MDIGKLSNALLEQLIFARIAKKGARNEFVTLRPGVGEDCAVMDFGGERIIVSADPITGASADAGYLAVHVNVNDIASSGGEPVGILLTLLLPPGVSETEISAIMDGAAQASSETGVEIIGGHTEVTDAVTRPIISAAVIGKTVAGRFVPTGGGKPGDDLVMTKWAGLEGTAVLAADKRDVLRGKISDKLLAEATDLKLMISVLPEGRLAVRFGASAMHDVTEGGVLGACFELAEASGTGIDVFTDTIPILNCTREICNLLKLNPLRLISSGAMLIAAPNGPGLVASLREAGVFATHIGKLTNSGKRCLSANGDSELTPPGADELYRILN